MNDRLKRHWAEYKYLYLGLGAGLTVAGITYAIMRDQESRSIGHDVIVTAGRDVIVTRKKVETNNVSYISANRQGPPSWVIRCLETNELFTSQYAATQKMDVSSSNLSRHLNGHQDHANGYHFERICMAA